MRSTEERRLNEEQQVLRLRTACSSNGRCSAQDDNQKQRALIGTAKAVPCYKAAELQCAYSAARFSVFCCSSCCGAASLWPPTPTRMRRPASASKREPSSSG